ncbi:hypothetical protein JGX82_001975 [Salmonella enterica]|uniref:Replication initiation protein n=1 Tax=Salmonella enterica TaxID=28901 RepID=A0A5U1R510_SALER|nr:hypothetical protein [Salmonella enterica]ECB7205701.1 hypothetical protein [Salmonella enterica subsp. enterica serovar Abaetetuba]EDI2723086.1 hypothetical protein [Salmonella enterica subsp. enterica serovar Rubislaw]EDL1779328.1 hypothetical protein [Salmonella enterica subsp. enterica serovar Poona]EDU7668667.1 hypothetical protein [Salmonella enterica subsp. enterica serovar Glostrup]EDV5252787.1 hypothetical protein [Salmonella enterica subsp. enterica]EDX4383064.1 hypothetical prot
MKKKKVSPARADDLVRSVFVGRSVLKNKLYARIDKLAFVSTLCEKADNSVLWNRIFGLSECGRYQIKKRKAGKQECSGLYQSVIEVRQNGSSKDHPLLMAIYFKPTAKKTRKRGTDGMVYHERGAIRFEFSPQHYKSDEITNFILWLGEKSQLGDMLYQLLKNAWITRIDYALDIVGMYLHDYYLSLSGASTGEVYDPDNGMHGLRIGNANLIASCYEKVDVRELSQKEFKRASLLELDFNEYRDFLRIELRLLPRKGDLRLGSLNHMENLPKRLAFYNKALRKDKRLDPMFASLLDQGMSIPQARCVYKPSSVVNGKAVSTNKKQAMKRLERCLKKHQVRLFDAECLWNNLSKVIDKIGIVGMPQYWDEKIRNKWLEKRR